MRCHNFHTKRLLLKAESTSVLQSITAIMITYRNTGIEAWKLSISMRVPWNSLRGLLHPFIAFFCINAISTNFMFFYCIFHILEFVSYIRRYIKVYHTLSTFPHTDPSFFNTATTVLHKILISRAILQLLIYSVSRLTTSSKSVISLRPLTCHSPVSPGLVASLAR